MKQITIGILTDYDRLFYDLISSLEGNVKYIRIRNVEDIRGRVFDGYCVIGSIDRIKDAYEVIEAIKNRIKEKI